MNHVNSSHEVSNAPWKYRNWAFAGVALAVVLCFALGVTSRLQLLERNSGSIGKTIPYHQLSARLPGSGLVDVGNRGDDDLRPAQTMAEALRQLRQFYVERIEDTQEKDLAYGSVRKMLDSLADPQSRFLLPDQRDLIDDAMKGRFHGIGAVFGTRMEKANDSSEMKLVVIAPLPGSPAEKAGLKPGDAITEVDGKWLVFDPDAAWTAMVKGVMNKQIPQSELNKALKAAKEKMDNGITIQKAADQLTKRSADKMSITVTRAGSPKPLKMTIAPADIEVQSVEHRVIDSSTGYIRINYFGLATSDAFATALGDLREQKVSKLLLDLRDCPGGSVDAALRVSGWLIPGKPFAEVVKARNAREVVRAPVPGKDAENKARALEMARAFPKPMVVIINNGTSGAAEVLAAALRDNQAGILVGTKTYGDFLQHTLFVLRDGSAITFTTGKYLTPKKLDLNQKGLTADFAAAPSATGDIQLEKALNLLKAKAGA